MISMTRQQQGDFNRCCDFLARMIEKYGDRDAVHTTHDSW